MKKTLRLIGLCALVMLAAVSCKKNEEKNVTFQATLTQPSSDSKTHIDANNNLVWNSGDQIKVYTADNTEASAAVFSTTSNNTMTATFSGTLTESASYTAFYPAEGVTVSGSKILMPLNATQTFVDGNMASGAYPMYATGTGETFTFHSPAGLLMLKFMGSGTIGSVELTDKNGANLAGNYEVDPANNTCTFVGNATTVTLNCGEGVALNTETETVMYFVLPAGVFDGGFTAVVKNTTGGEMYTLSTTRANLIVAEKILEMPTVNVAAISVTTGTAVAGDVPTTMTLNGSYSAPAGMNVSEVGFYWGQGADLTEHQTATLGTNFSLVVEDLTEGTEYSYYAYAKNGNNVIVGETLTFTTGTSVTVPTVVTGEVTNIASTSAMCGAQVTSNGGATVTQRGICWSVTPNPTLGSCSDNHFSDESFDPFELSMNGLSPNTTYYVRAFATNSAGTAYGEDVSFQTAVALPSVTTASVTDITANSALVGGTITNDGNGTISARGVSYKIAVEDNWTDVVITSTNATFSTTLNLSPSTTYVVRAYATNEAGTGYGEETTFATLSAHPYVDLGLPSGLLWATCNVGADSPEDYGDYFAWGETTPKSTYTWDNYQFGTSTALTKYNESDGLTTLLPEDDAATANWGDGWRMPTRVECQELLNNTTWSSVQQNGVDGLLITGPNGNSIFLPWAGRYDGSNLQNAGRMGYFWMNVLNAPKWARCVNFSYSAWEGDKDRYCGYSVRPVRDAE